MTLLIILGAIILFALLNVLLLKTGHEYLSPLFWIIFLAVAFYWRRHPEKYAEAVRKHTEG